MTDITGALNVDATRGEFNQFVVQGKQIMFPDRLFNVRRLTPTEAYDRTAPPSAQVGRELTEEGRKLYDQVAKLGGKGVTVTGETFERQVQFTHEFSRPQECIEIFAIRAEPKADPPLNPFLATLLKQKQEREKEEGAKKEAERLSQEETAIRQELLREEMKERMREDRKKGKQPVNA